MLRNRLRRWIARGSAIALVLLISGAATAQDSRTLSSRVAARDLIFYVEFDGLDAHSKDWKASAAYKALNQTTLGALIKDLAAQGLDLAMKGKVANPPKGTEVVERIELFGRRGFALGVNGRMPETPRFTLVIRGGSGPDAFGLLEATKNADEKAAKKVVKKGSRTVTTFGAKPGDDAFIDDKGDLVVTTVSDLDKALAVLDGKEPNASTHPSVVELAKPDGTFRPTGLAFVDPKALPALPPNLVALGIDGLKRVDYRWGFNGDALSTVFRLVAPTPRRGLLALIDGPTFTKTTLPPIPAGVTDFSVAMLTPAQLFDKLVAIAKQVAPGGGPQVDAIRQQVDQILGVKIRDDVLARLGPKWSVYPAPSAPGGLPIDFVALTDLADPTRFEAALGQVLEVVNDQVRASRQNAPSPKFVKLAGGPLGYELTFPPGMLPGPLSSVIKPTILLGKKSLAIASGPKSAAAAIALAEGGAARWKPDAAFTPVLNSLPTGLVALNVSDPRKSLPQTVAGLPAILAGVNASMPNPAGPGAGPTIPIQIKPELIPSPAELAAKLFPSSGALSVDAQGIKFVTREAFPSLGNPATTGVAVALLLPAVQAAREAARRTQCVNNLKLMGLAFFNHHDANGKFPTNVYDKQGKPLLSWRVQILPYIEQETLYKKFKLDEPWDSPNNKPLLQEMPAIFTCPSHPRMEPGQTCYQGWSGPNTFFRGSQGTSMANITDGSSSTVAVVETMTTVPWTKPDDLPFDPKSPVPLLGASSAHPGGFNALICDGSVKFLKTTINPATLRSLITINGAEIIAPNDF